MALYDITQLDDLEHNTTYGRRNSLIKIDDTHFILAYSSDEYDGSIKTFSIDSSGNITQIDELTHETSTHFYTSLKKIDSTHFILAYGGEDSDGFIKIFSIDSSYDNITQVSSLEHDGVYGRSNSLVMIDSTHFILAYGGDGSDGYIKTFSIDGNYAVTQIDSIEHDTSNGMENSLVMIDSTHFILAYEGYGSDGHIKTFSIDSSYNNITEIDNLTHDIDGGGYNSLVMIDSTHFILAYAGDDDNGTIKTFSIDSNYDNITKIDSLEHNAYSGYHHSMIMIDSTHFVLAYSGYSYPGYIKTFSIDSSYDNIAQVNTLTHSSDGGTYCSLVNIDNHNLILAYAGADDDGFIKTFDIDAPTIASDDAIFFGINM